MSKGIKCRNCGHVVDCLKSPEEWFHKYTKHDDNCECRNPEPNWEPILKEIEKAMDEATEKSKKEPKPRFDNSRGWNQLTVEEMFRPFTI